MAFIGERGVAGEQNSGKRRRNRRIFALALLVIGFVAIVVYAPPHQRVAVAASAARRKPTRTAQTTHLDSVVDTPMASAGCGKKPPVALGTSADEGLISGGHLRMYRLHVPSGYLPFHSYPLVLNFHGHSSTAEHQESSTGFSRLADHAGFLVAYPQGVVGPDGRTGWASGGPSKPHVDDVLFVSDLLTKLQSELCIDPQRIYATGFSNGGGLTSVLACRMAGRIAAFAPVSGSYFPLTGGCAPGRAVPILEFHGTSDIVVPYSGRPWQQELGAQDWLSAWAVRDGCAAQPTQFYSSSGVTGLEWKGCQGGAAVIHYRIAGGAHVWPDATDGRMPAVDRAINATALIWRFFVAHPLPPDNIYR